MINYEDVTGGHEAFVAKIVVSLLAKAPDFTLQQVALLRMDDQVEIDKCTYLLRGLCLYFEQAKMFTVPTSLSITDDQIESLTNDALENLNIAFRLGKKCNHIIGYEEGVDEAWLCYADCGFHHKVPQDGEDIRFKFCPLCGEKLQ